MTKSLSGLVFHTVILTPFKISFNFNGVMSEKGRYPFAKILIAAAYMHSQVISSLYNKTYLSFTVLRYSSALWSSVVCLVHLHIRIEVLIRLLVLQTVSHWKMLCTVFMSCSSVSAM